MKPRTIADQLVKLEMITCTELRTHILIKIGKQINLEIDFMLLSTFRHHILTGTIF